LSEPDVSGRTGVGDLRTVSTARQRVSQTGRMAGLRHRVHRAAVQRRDGRGAGDGDGVSQRDRRAQPHRADRLDGAPRARQVRSASTEGAADAAGSFESGPLSQYLGPHAEVVRRAVIGSRAVAAAAVALEIVSVTSPAVRPYDDNGEHLW